MSRAWQEENRRPSAPASGDAPATTQDAAAASVAPQKPAGEAIASVNGRPVRRDAVLRTLISGYGLGVLQQHIALAVVQQEAEKAGVQISESDIEREYDLSVQGPTPDGSAPAALTPASRQALIEVWLKRTGVSSDELRIAMTRQAYLRRLVEPKVEVTEQALSEEYDRQYGERVQVRLIQVASMAEMRRVTSALASGADFAGLAAQYSIDQTSARDGGLLPPFSMSDERFPKQLREAAFALQPGQVSNPLQFDGFFHVMKAERRLSRQAVAPAFVKSQLEKAARVRLTARMMDETSVRLLQEARIRIDDPTLRDAYRREVAAGRAVGPPLQN